MFHSLKNACIVGLLLLHGMAFAQQFNLQILVDRNGNPSPNGNPFNQYFYSYSVPEDIIVSIGGRRYLFQSSINCDGIRRNHLDVILWEIEKEMRCDAFKLNQIKNNLSLYDTSSNKITSFLQVFPGNSECLAPIFYLWQQTAGRNISVSDNFQAILATMGTSGKKYAASLEENNSRYGMMRPPVLNKELLSNYTNQPFEVLIDNIRRKNCSGSTFRPNNVAHEQVNILQMLDQKPPTEIVKYLLANNIIKAQNLSWLALFLEMCDEWPPEAVEFLKKQYASPDPKYSSSVRDIIVAASIKNNEMINWLKPYMDEFANQRKKTKQEPAEGAAELQFHNKKTLSMDSRVGAAYMLITGKSDPIKIAQDYISYYSGFIYEYAHATGKYNEACDLIRSDPSIQGWGDSSGDNRMPYTMLYDRSNLTTENRIMLLKQFLRCTALRFSAPGSGGQNIEIPDFNRNLSKELRLLHPDNLPALMELTKDAQYVPAAWLAIKAFPVKKMPPEVVAQYFANCKQDLKSSDPKVRNEAIRCLRFFTPDAQRPETVKMLFAMLLSSDQAVASAADGSLAAMGPACMPELLEIIGGNDPYFAVRACEFIGAMGLYGQEATPELIKLLNASSDWMLKTMIIKALALIKGTEAIPEIEKYVSDKQTTLAQTATQALVLLKPIPKEILNDPSEFVQNYFKPGAR